MANKKDTVQITFRAPTEVIKQLDELCRMSGIKRSEFIVACITSEHDKINGNPKLREILEQFRSISEQMKQLTSGVSPVVPSDAQGDGQGPRKL